MESEDFKSVEASQVSDILSDVTQTPTSSEIGEAESSQNVTETIDSTAQETGLNLGQLLDDFVPKDQHTEDNNEVAVEAVNDEAYSENNKDTDEKRGEGAEDEGEGGQEQEKEDTISSGDFETAAEAGGFSSVVNNDGDNEDTEIKERDETTSLETDTSEVKENLEGKVEQDLSEVSGSLVNSAEQTNQVQDDINKEMSQKALASVDTDNEDKEQVAELGEELNEEEMSASVEDLQPEASEKDLTEARQHAEEETLPTEDRVVEGAESIEEENKGDTIQDAKDKSQAVDDKRKEETKGATKEKKATGEWVDILGNGLLKKKTIIEGKGEESRPKPGNEVSLKVSGTLENGTPLKEEDFNFILDDREVIQAFDLCVALMELGEKAMIYTDAKYAFGPFGCNDTDPIIPKNCNITYNVELLSVKEGPNKETMSDQARIEIGDKKRLRGNSLYTRGDYGSAIDCYKRALKFLEGSASKDVIEMKVKCQNNLSAAQIKVNAYQAALQSCNAVLNLQTGNIKAMFRKAKCQEALGDAEEALKCLKQASMLDPNNKMIHSELIRLGKYVKKNKQKESDMYKRMVEGLKKDESDEGVEEESSFPYKLMVGTMIAAGIGIVAGFLWNRH